MAQMQDRLVKFLEKNYDQLFTLSDLASSLNVPKDRVSKALKACMKWNEIKKVEIPREQAKKIYGKNIKRRIGLYCAVREVK
ncbi:MAG: hypothetical protein ACOC1X_01725 [Promethearchaeota archaeon]